MEVIRADLPIGEYSIEFSSDERHDKREWNVEDSIVDADAQLERSLDETKNESSSLSSITCKNLFYTATSDCPVEKVNSIRCRRSATCNNDNVLHTDESTRTPDDRCESEETNGLAARASEIFVKSAERTKNLCDIATIVVPSDIHELSLGIKRETENFHSQRSSSSTRRASRENFCDNFVAARSDKRKKNESIMRNRSAVTRQSLRKKADRMREKRRNLHVSESAEERNARLSREASKRRETRMYYETPERRRKRLDNEAARKREYRMYSESADERRKRLDREAERRRVKRLTIYANETQEERRERLNRESSRRRESRLSRYARESESERQERLEKDATRAREMRFTRSAIESDEERRERLVKDALRKRELRMHGCGGGDDDDDDDDRMRNLTELRAVKNFEESNDAGMREEPPRGQEKRQQDNQFSGHCIGNWMMWFQNTIDQSESNGDTSNAAQTDV